MRADVVGLTASVSSPNWTPHTSSGPASMRFRTILAVTDLSARGNDSVRCAAMLAVNCGAELRLMYVPPTGNAGCAEHETGLRELAHALADGGRLSVEVIARSGRTLDEVAIEANASDLFVAPYRRQFDLASFFLGEWYQRLMRLSRCPVLLPRSGGLHPYSKIVVAVDFDDAALRLVQFACGLDKRAELRLFHAVSRSDEAKLRSADVSWEVVKAFRRRQAAYAGKRLRELVRSVDAGERALTFSTASGDAGHQTAIHQSGLGASLIVVGKRRRSGLQEFMSGSVSHRVLASSSADVLIVPHDHRTSSRAAAKLRIASDAVGVPDALHSR